MLSTVQRILQAERQSQESAKAIHQSLIEEYNRKYEADARADFQQWIGEDLYFELLRYVQPIDFQDNADELHTHAQLWIAHAPDLGLAPFMVHRRNGEIFAMCNGERCHTIDKAIVAAVEHEPHYRKMEAREAKAALEREIDKMRYLYSSSYDDQDISDAHSALLNLDPDLAVRLMCERAERQNAAAERRAEQDRLSAEYRAAYTVYFSEYNQALDHNDRTIARWQRDLAEQIEVTTIRYGILVEEDPRVIVMHHDVDTLGQDENGAWLVITPSGAVEPWHFHYIAGESTRTITVGAESGLCPYVRIGYGVESKVVFFRPGKDAAKIQEMITGELLQVPFPPPPPPALHTRNADQVRKEVADAYTEPDSLEPQSFL